MDIEELLAEYDPIRDHDMIMAATRVDPPPPRLVYKHGPVTRQQPGEHLPLPPNDLVDSLAQVLVELREDCRVMIDDAVTPLRERVAVLEGQLSLLVNMVGGNGNGGKSLEASEVIRKVRVGR